MSDSPMNDAVLAGVPRLLDDLQKLLETHDHADILFLVGREETAFYAHRLLLNIRYHLSFQLFFFSKFFLPQLFSDANHRPS